MTARDRWTIDLKCPVCGKIGEARVSQADGWEFERDQSTRVDFTPEGFDFDVDDPSGQPKFRCIEHGDLRRK
ncbi:hypothetical protein [Rhizobium leguminosarum]|uniref:hypothetical protein n=1 Tax=Rhizobium leguminosarum TaxID=384 RepID=UPI00103199B7|nr:hypothetical protein [Rhizobium leguminosarum]TAY68444.1 hypothetical protein ELH82_20795 [Rhizobium leguminosarum]